MSTARGPLAGVRVIELGGIGPGPYAGMLLADMGADVIRVDRPNSPVTDSPIMRRGKRFIELDLRSDADRGTAVALAARADLVIEGFRPGVVEKLGIGPDVCLARNPALVYGRITGWGQSGPMAQEAGHDINYIGLVGALHAIGRAGEPPTIPLCLAGDLGGGGMFFVTGLLAALVYARASGRGQVVDSAIVDGAAVLMAPTYGRLATGTWTDERGTNLLDGGRPWYNVYETSDGRWMAVGAIEDQFYENLVRVLGLDPGESERSDPAKWETLRIRMAGIFRQRTQEEWTATFSGAEACVTPVLSLRDAPRHPHSLERGTFDGHGWPRSGPVFAVTPTGPAASPPERGRDSASILRDWLGAGRPLSLPAPEVG
jgi:alpha-methylacyl-CoA racemase